MASSNPTNIDEFLALLVSSGLLDLTGVQSACAEFDRKNGLDALCSHLIRQGVLSYWQCNNLRNGKHQGFFLDHYRFRGHLSVQENTSTFLADDLETGKRVALEITPPTIVPLRDGKPQYKVVKVFDD